MLSGSKQLRILLNAVLSILFIPYGIFYQFFQSLSSGHFFE